MEDGGGDSDHDDDNMILGMTAEEVFDELRDFRVAWSEAGGAEQAVVDFKSTLRGGTWTALHRGLIADSVRA